MDAPLQLHGPYYEWSIKVAGKTRTRRLSKEQAKLCQEWLRDHKTLKRIVRQMEQISLIETDRTLGRISKA
jgi:transposase